MELPQIEAAKGLAKGQIADYIKGREVQPVDL